MGRTAEAISALVDLLDFSPTDAESWAELSDLYLSQSMYSQAIFSLEEVLVITPFAWNVHARMGELLYISATAANNTDGNVLRNLSESLRRFCRSIELCDNYLRGYYGLKLVRIKDEMLSPSQSQLTSPLPKKRRPRSSSSLCRRPSTSKPLPTRLVILRPRLLQLLKSCMSWQRPSLLRSCGAAGRVGLAGTTISLS